LLGQAVAGDTKARNQLLESLLPRFRNQVRRSLNVHCADAQSDVLLSVVRRVCAQSASLPPTLPRFLAWVGAIVRNRCHDKWREWKGQPAQLGPQVDVAESEEKKDGRSALVWTALQLLPEERYRTVLEHTFYGRMSAKEIGNDMGVSEGAVRILRHRALKKMRALLEKRHEE
jgi:RNA polymerase sigma-70 factor (ECF subfamily)